jgi:hypothetical protein
MPYIERFLNHFREPHKDGVNKDAVLLREESVL